MVEFRAVHPFERNAKQPLLCKSLVSPCKERNNVVHALEKNRSLQDFVTSGQFPRPALRGKPFAGRSSQVPFFSSSFLFLLYGTLTHVFVSEWVLPPKCL